MSVCRIFSRFSSVFSTQFSTNPVHLDLALFQWHALSFDFCWFCVLLCVVKLPKRAPSVKPNTNFGVRTQLIWSRDAVLT